jgi:DNA-binding NtrC family response regulator
MAKKDVRILILEDDTCFRGILEGVCAEMGEVVSAADRDSALAFLSEKNFDLLMLDWHLIQPDLSTVRSTVENFQPGAYQVALFTVPDLFNVITAMKSGMSDILWAAQDIASLKAKIEECLAHVKPAQFTHSLVSQLAESLTEKAMVQKTSLFQARKEFSRTFLHQVLRQQKLRRTQLASLMSVSPRTLHRHLSA